MIYERLARLEEIKKILKLKNDLLKAAREKNKNKILKLYEKANTLDFDVIGDKLSAQYNKAIDKCIDVVLNHWE